MRTKIMDKSTLHAIIVDAIERIGIETFKKTSLFARNQKTAAEIKKAA